MVKLTGPLISQSASGTLGKVLTYNKQPGQTTLRRKPQPKHPRTTSQVAVQTALTFVTQQWKELNQAEKDTWDHPDFVDAVNPYTNYVKFNCRRIRSCLGPTIEYPGDIPTDPCNGFAVGAMGVYRAVRLAWVCHFALHDSWGIFIFRARSVIPPPEHKYLCHVGIMDDQASHLHYDGPLEPGSYCYRFKGFSTSGQFTASHIQAFIIVTD